jgi:hypothetical protein
MRHNDKHVAMTLRRIRHPPPPLKRLVRVAVTLCDDLMGEKSVLSSIGNPREENKYVLTKYAAGSPGS